MNQCIKYIAFYFREDQLPVFWRERVGVIEGAFIGQMLVVTIANFLGGLYGMAEWLKPPWGQVRYWFLLDRKVLWLNHGLPL